MRLKDLVLDLDTTNDVSGQYEVGAQAQYQETAVEQGEKISNNNKDVKNLDATQMYLDAIGMSPLLTAEQEVTYARRALQGSCAARKRMIECNLRLVVSIAKRYQNRGLALLDFDRRG